VARSGGDEGENGVDRENDDEMRAASGDPRSASSENATGRVD